MPPPQYDAAIDYALERLREELSPRLIYHSLRHTQHDVMPAARLLAKMSGLSVDDTHLVEVAAAFHDLGFIETYRDHEEASARLAGLVLPRFGFAPAQIEQIVSMILATRLPQSPVTLLEMIIADADLDVLGREDFFERNEVLRQEMARYHQGCDRREWLRNQLEFLQNHCYYTPAARSLRDRTKEQNLALLEAMVREDQAQTG